MQTTDQSLLQRLLEPNPSASDWETLHAIYEPYIRTWIGRLGFSVDRQDVDDVVQEVLTVVVANIVNFRHGRAGAFRAWLKEIVRFRVLDYLKAARKNPRGLGGWPADCPLAQVEDPNSAVSRWLEEEHNLYVLRRLLELAEHRFETSTLVAFRRQQFDGASAEEAAEELGISINAAYLAKSKVLKWLREEARGLV
jgi:RNA polymerase sigma-70 factor (ECF subfamily)